MPEALDSPLFTHPGDLTEPILGLLPLALALVAVAICLVGLVRGWLTESLLTTGLVALPLIAFALTNAVLLDRSKETAFCTSCHVMEPIYQSLQENDGSLASTHASRGAVPAAQSCYTCHSGYGMQGDMAAKLSGLRHMVHTVTGRYDLPLRISGAYKIESCLACHAEGSAFRGQEAHHDEDIQQALLSGEMGCTGTCHPSAHPDSALTGGSVAE